MIRIEHDIHCDTPEDVYRALINYNAPKHLNALWLPDYILAIEWTVRATEEDPDQRRYTVYVPLKGTTP